MKFLKVISMTAAAAMLAAAVSGCGNGETKKEAADKLPSDIYEINWYTQGTTQSDTPSVEAKINEYLKDKINATVKLHILDSSQYAQKVGTMINAGEYFDLAFCASYLLDYKANAANGAFLALDDMLDEYMPKTKELLGEDFIDAAKINGKLYALPVNKEKAAQAGWLYRKDIADKYNINMNSIKSFDELEPYLLQIQANEPDMKYPIDWKTDNTPLAFIQYELLAGPAAVMYGKYDGKVVNFYETEEYEQACRTSRKFFEDGLIKKDIMTSSDFKQRIQEGKTFCCAYPLKPGKAKEISKDYKFEMSQAEVTPVIEDNQAATGAMLAISRTSKKPERTARFLELLNNDEYLYNLVLYGIEGKHYLLTENGQVRLMPQSSYTLSGSEWMFGNVFLAKLKEGEDPNKMENLKAFNNQAEKPLYYGFKFDSSSVDLEAAACKKVISQYNRQAVLGAMDPDTVLPEFRSKLKEVGADKVIAEAQKQYDAFLAEKNRK